MARQDPLETTRRALFRRGAVFATAGAGAALAACGTLGQSAAPSRSAARVELELWSLQHPPHQVAWGKLLDTWHAKQPNVRVTNLPQPGASYGDKIDAAVAAGTVPEMVTTLGATVRIAKGFFTQVDDIFRQARVDPKKDFWPAATEAWLVKGKYWGVPLEDGAAWVGFVVRHDLLDKAGVRLPAGDMPFSTWDALYDAAKRAVVKGATPETTVMGWSSAIGQIPQVLLSAMVEGGGSYDQYFDRAKGKWTINNPVGVDVLKKLIWDPANSLGIEDPANTAAGLALRQGKVAMGIEGTGVKSVSRAANEDATPFLENFVGPPFKGTERKIVNEGGWGVAVFQQSAKKEQATPFLVWLAGDPQVGAVWNATSECRVPPRPGQLDKLPECTGPEWEGGRRERSMQKSIHYVGNEGGGHSLAYAAFNPVVRDLRENKLSPQAAVAQIEERLNQAFDELVRAVGPLR